MTRHPGTVHEDTRPIPGLPLGPPDDGAPGLEHHSEPSPVFVDTSGRRQRRVRRLGWVLVVPAAAYVLLLLSTLLGGPTVHSPLLPDQQPAAAQPSSPAADPDTAPEPSTVSGTPSATRTAPTNSARSTPHPTGAAAPATPTAGSAPSTAVTAGPTPGAGHGKPSSAPGQSNKPSTKP